MALTGTKFTTAIGGTTTTVTNTNVQTTYLYSPNLSINTGSNTIQVNASRTSGTLAGSATLYGSLDGINWVATALESAVNFVDGATSIISILTTKRYLYYRLAITTSGTVVAVTEAYILEDKDPIS